MSKAVDCIRKISTKKIAACVGVRLPNPRRDNEIIKTKQSEPTWSVVRVYALRATAFTRCANRDTLRDAVL